MKLRVIFLLSLLFFISCKRTIILRVDPVAKVPFDKKISEGDYELNVYELKYPEDLLGKENFYNKLNISVKKMFIKDQKRSVIISEDFYNDYLLINEGKLLDDEIIIEKIASNLTQEEKNELKKMATMKIEKFDQTVQEYLNIQIYYLMKILDRMNEFEESKIYTEREKNNLILEIKNQRQETIKVIKKMDLDLIVKIRTPYSEKIKERYWDDVDIELKNSSNNLRSDLANYTLPIFIKNLQLEDITNILTRGNNFQNKVILIENKIYSGYLYDVKKNKYVFLIGGSKTKNYFPNYRIKINIREVEFEELISLSEEYILTDFTGGK